MGRCGLGAAAGWVLPSPPLAVDIDGRCPPTQGNATTTCTAIASPGRALPHPESSPGVYERLSPTEPCACACGAGLCFCVSLGFSTCQGTGPGSFGSERGSGCPVSRLWLAADEPPALASASSELSFCTGRQGWVCDVHRFAFIYNAFHPQLCMSRASSQKPA